MEYSTIPHDSRWRFVLLACLLVCGTPAVAGESKSGEQVAGRAKFAALAPGLDYCHEARAAGPLSIHVLRVDRLTEHWELQTGLGQGTVFGLEPLSGIVARVSSALHKPVVAAINGDFFVIKPGPYQGDPRGIQITDGELVSRPTGNSFWVTADGQLRIGPIVSKLRASLPDRKTDTPIGLNEARPDDGAVLFTPILGIRRMDFPVRPQQRPTGDGLGSPSYDKTGNDPSVAPKTRTQGGKELILERVEGNDWLPLRVGVCYSARIREVRESGDTPLSADRMILSIGPKAAPDFSTVKAGDVVRLAIETQPNLAGVKTAIGGGRVLVSGGKTPDVGPPTQPRHPRSMIGWNRQHLFFFVIDGRRPWLSIGMTYPEMAALARQYECTDAIELDGGGSSTLWASGKIFNTPSDGWPRAIANGLILLRTDSFRP